MLDIALLSDIFPTGFYGAKSAGVDAGKTVYIAGTYVSRVLSAVWCLFWCF